MKLFSYITFFAALLICNFSQAQNVLTVGDDDVTLADFQHIYGKNNRDSIITKVALDEYMGLFVKFKLKVLEAEALGMDTVAEFVRELSGYRKQLSRPYLVDTDLLDELVLEAYNRQQEEVRARHILVSAGANATPGDTLRAWNRITELRNRVADGADFEKVARDKNGSDDPSARDNGGDLGWFTAFQMVYPFEQAAYTTEVGELSDIVRTRFGYHFLEVTGKREARGEIQVAHIMISVADMNAKPMLESAKTKIDAVAAFLKTGESFESLALKYSDDKSSNSKGGVLPWFTTGKMVESFEDASFALQSDGDISEPFMTSYGWHIVMRIGYKTPDSFDAVKRALKKKVSRDARAEGTRTSFLRKLKAEYNFSISSLRVQNLENAVSKTDSVFHKGHPIKITKGAELGRKLFSIAGEVTTVQDFLDYIASIKPRGTDRLPNVILHSLIDQLIEEKLLAYEDSMLEEKHYEFRLLIDEYHDGILLFELTDKMVWSKAVKDTTGLEEFHAQNEESFMWEERLDISAYTCENAAIAKQVKKALKKGESIIELRRALIEEKPLAIKIEEGLYALGNNNWADSIFNSLAQGSLVIPSDVPIVITLDAGGDAVVVINVKTILQPTPKTLDEARGQVIAAYQDYLEAQWIEALRNKYSVEINHEILYGLID
jgi:peptidyl-prolyl cis-trans isomerase SurA